MIEGSKVTIEIWNNDWYQTDTFLIATKLKFFKAAQIFAIKDNDTVNNVKQAIKNNDHIDSFIAIEIKHRIQGSHVSK